MVRSTVAAVVSLLFPGLGHIFIKFELLRGLLISLGYLSVTFTLMSNGLSSVAFLFVIPSYHLIAALLAYTN